MVKHLRTNNNEKKATVEEKPLLIPGVRREQCQVDCELWLWERGCGTGARAQEEECS